MAALLYANKPYAQTTDTLRLPTAAADTLAPPPKTSAGFFNRFFKKDYPNPRKAALIGLVFPGGGQIYNKRWWKLPLVYGGIGVALGFEISNIKEYRAARDNYLWEVDGIATTNPEGKFTGRDATTLRQYRDTFRRYVEMSSIALAVTYMLSVSEAYVDAHLKNFNINEDLGFRIKPSFQAAPNGPAVGLGLAWAF